MIGLDLSLSDTGFAALSGDDTIIDIKSIRTKSGVSDDTRVRFIVDAIRQLVEFHMDGTELSVFIEAIPFTKRPTGKHFTRCELFGIVKYVLTSLGVDIYTVSATTLKSKFAGHGTADKHNVQAAVYNRYNRTIKNDNIADAVGLASIGNRYISNELKMTVIKISKE